MSVLGTLTALNGDRFSAFDRDYFKVRPAVPVSVARHRYAHAVERCDVVFVIARDFSRVFVGQEFYGGFREADALEIEALAERFGLDELKRAAVLRQTA